MQRNEVKGNLAKLLATENLVVEHRQCETAQFDVDRRVLTLPTWDLASNDVYDMLVGHEVGHALFTPNRDWRADVDCSMDYVNIVEDARIEKLMKRKYPGLKKSFSRGYAELNAQDFFGTAGKDLISYNLIDRINLHFKSGSFELIPFEEFELQFVEAVENVETFDEVLEVAKRIYDWQKKKEQEQIEDAEELVGAETKSEGGGEGSDDLSEEEINEEIEEAEEEQQQQDSQDPAQLDTPSYEGGDSTSPNAKPEGGKGGKEIESETQKSFDELAKELSRPNSHLSDVNYIEIPKKIKMDNFVTDWKDVHDWIDTQREGYLKSVGERFPESDLYPYRESDAQFREFKKSNNKEVNYLVKEFECRKSADAYARAGTSRTGVLNTAKLHEYKFNEDIFKRITTIPDGKNHGMIFLLDWSGSMANEILATVKQLISLTSFCKKVQIPFEVYAFSNDWYVAKNSIETGEEIEYYGSHNWYGNYDRQHNNLKEGEFYFDKLQFDLINVISSRSNSKDYERQCLNLFREAWCYRNRCHYQPTAGLGLSGTPLNEAVVMLNYLIPEFKRNNDLQKVNVCILTDGESASATYGRKVRREYVEDFDVRPGRVDYNTCLRDRQTGRVYKPFNGNFSEVTSTFIQQVRDRHPEVSVVGFRILSARDLSTFVGRYGSRETSYEEVQKQWRKDKSAIIPNPMSFTALYAIANTALDDDAEFEVAQDATKGQITRAFKKMLKTKGSNKKLLSSFIGHVS
tara:strand:- start:481 stop:2715 length:2235 start_codon:yes stop_codon:yes gene_type:complete